MFKRFQFSISDMLWATAVIAVLLSVFITLARNTLLKLTAVGLLLALVISLPTVFAALSQPGDSKYSEPFVSRKTFFAVAILAGVSFPFLAGLFVKVVLEAVQK
jgi:hypothetical protein